MITAQYRVRCPGLERFREKFSASVDVYRGENRLRPLRIFPGRYDVGPPQYCVISASKTWKKNSQYRPSVLPKFRSLPFRSVEFHPRYDVSHQCYYSRFPRDENRSDLTLSDRSSAEIFSRAQVRPLIPTWIAGGFRCAYFCALSSRRRCYPFFDDRPANERRPRRAHVFKANRVRKRNKVFRRSFDLLCVVPIILYRIK